MADYHVPARAQREWDALAAANPDPVDELGTVIAQALEANALRVTTSRGGYVGGGRPHATMDSDPGAVEALARSLLARQVAEPSRVHAASSSPPGLNDPLLAALIDAADTVVAHYVGATPSTPLLSFPDIDRLDHALAEVNAARAQ